MSVLTTIYKLIKWDLATDPVRREDFNANIDIIEANLGNIGTKHVDETGLATGKMPVYDSVSGKYIMVDKPTNGTNGATGAGVVAGGTAGQVLAKVDSTDYNTYWVTPESGGTGTGSGDMLASNYDPVIKSITGKTSGTTNADKSLADLWNLKWTEKFILFNPADGYISDELPLSRNGTMVSMDFRVKTAGSNAVIIVKQNGVALSPTVTLGSVTGKTTLTFTTPVVGAEDDLFTYTVTGAGLASSSIVCNQKWVNR